MLADGAAALGLPLTEAQLLAFDNYAALLATWRQRFNLTAVRAPNAVVRVHFLDSLAYVRGAEIPPGASVIDVGSGAGFPGVPLKIARTDLQMTLLEAVRRRAAFLELVDGALELDAEVIHGRAEAIGHLPNRREQYDLVVSRATAPLPRLVEICLPFVKIGGLGIFAKGGNVNVETTSAAANLLAVGGVLVHTVPVDAPWDPLRKRVLVVVRKTSQTPTKFPRARPARGESS